MHLRHRTHLRLSPVRRRTDRLHLQERRGVRRRRVAALGLATRPRGPQGRPSARSCQWSGLLDPEGPSSSRDGTRLARGPSVGDVGIDTGHSRRRLPGGAGVSADAAFRLQQQAFWARGWGLWRLRRQGVPLLFPPPVRFDGDWKTRGIHFPVAGWGASNEYSWSAEMKKKKKRRKEEMMEANSLWHRRDVLYNR